MKWRLLRSAHVGVRPLARWLALQTRGPVQRFGGGQWRLLCLAWFAWLGLLGLRQGQAADASACTARSRPRLKVGRVAVLSLLSPRYWWPRVKFGGGGSSACCAHDAWLALFGVGRVSGVVP